MDAANAAERSQPNTAVQRTEINKGIDGKAFLANMGRRDVTRDLDVLRAALGG